MKKKGALAFLCVALCIGFLVYHNQPVSLRIGIFSGSNWNVPSLESEKIVDHVKERFEKEYPNVEVTYIMGIRKEDYSQWLAKQALNGDLCDVYMVFSSDLATFSKTGLLENLDSYIEKDPDFDASKYFSSSYQAGEFDDHQFALPYESVPTLMYVNKTLLEQEGLMIPSQDWTWHDFYEICHQVTKDIDGDGQLDQFGQYGYSWQNALASNGRTIYNEEQERVDVNTKAMKESIEFVRSLERLNEGQVVTSEMFDRGQVVFCPMKFSEYRTYKPYPWSVKKYSNFQWDCIPMPSGALGGNVSELDTLLIGMSKTSTHKKAAWELLKKFSYDETTQKELFTYSQGVSVLRTVTNAQIILDSLEDETPGADQYNLDFFPSVMENAIPIKQFYGYEPLVEVVDNELRLLISSNEMIEDGLSNLQKRIERVIESVN